MKLRSGLISISLLSILSSTAQESSKAKLVFNGVSLYTGVLSHQGQVGSLSDFKKLAKGSELLETDLTGYDVNSLFYGNESGSIGGVNVHFKFVNDQKVDQKIFSSMRFGISLADGRNLSKSYSKSEDFRVDTLTSSRSGEEYYVDSTASQNLYLDYSQSQVFLSAAYLIGSNPEERFSFFTGVGLMSGIAIDASTYISKSNSSYTENSRSINDELTREYNSKSEDEYFKNKMAFTMIASIPIGVDFRIGTVRKFWKGSHLMLEYQPSLYYYSIPELNTSTMTTASIWSFTYKFQF